MMVLANLKHRLSTLLIAAGLMLLLFSLKLQAQCTVDCEKKACKPIMGYGSKVNGVHKCWKYYKDDEAKTPWDSCNLCGAFYCCQPDTKKLCCKTASTVYAFACETDKCTLGCPMQVNTADQEALCTAVKTTYSPANRSECKTPNSAGECP